MKYQRFFLAAALACSAGASVANPGDPVQETLTPLGGGAYSATFTKIVDQSDQIPGSGAFFDYFNFTPDSFAGRVSVTVSVLTGPVVFTNGGINNDSFGVPAGQTGTPPFSFQTLTSAGDSLQVQVFGGVFDASGNPADGSYSVSITAMPVPEPQTWALLIAGLGGIAFFARRKPQPRKIV